MSIDATLAVHAPGVPVCKRGASNVITTNVEPCTRIAMRSLDAPPTYFFGAQGFGGAQGFAAFLAAGALSLEEEAVLRNVSCIVLV